MPGTLEAKAEECDARRTERNFLIKASTKILEILEMFMLSLLFNIYKRLLYKEQCTQKVCYVIVCAFHTSLLANQGIKSSCSHTCFQNKTMPLFSARSVVQGLLLSAHQIQSNGNYLFHAHIKPAAVYSGLGLLL